LSKKLVEVGTKGTKDCEVPSENARCFYRSLSLSRCRCSGCIICTLFSLWLPNGVSFVPLHAPGPRFPAPPSLSGSSFTLSGGRARRRQPLATGVHSYRPTPSGRPRATSKLYLCGRREPEVSAHCTAWCWELGLRSTLDDDRHRRMKCAHEAGRQCAVQ